MMKKLITCLLVLVLVFCLAGCVSVTTDGGSGGTEQTQAEKEEDSGRDGAGNGGRFRRTGHEGRIRRSGRGE